MTSDLTSASGNSTGPFGPSEDWSGVSFCHEAFFFDDELQVVERCAPFIEEALELHQPTLIVASDGVRAALERHLGDGVRSAAVFDRAESWWQGPHATMAAYIEVLARLRVGRRPWRLVAEPVWLGTTTGRYWSRFEAVTNDTLAHVPYYSLCLHDHRRLDEAAVTAARQTHPLVRDAADPTVASGWRGAVDFLRRVEPQPIARPDGAVTIAHTALDPVRRHAEAACVAVGLPPRRTTEVVVAVGELAANALAVDAEVHVTDWQHDDHLVIEVLDHGPGFDDPLAGYVVPAPDNLRGRGLWLARALTDDLAIRSTTSGTLIQALVRLDQPRRTQLWT